MFILRDILNPLQNEFSSSKFGKHGQFRRVRGQSFIVGSVTHFWVFPIGAVDFSSLKSRSIQPQSRAELVDHNCGHIFLRVASESRPFPAYDIARSGEKMPGP